MGRLEVQEVTDPKELLLTALRATDAKRSRSTQVQIGPSEVGGCRRKVWYRLNDQPETNDNELKLAAIMGTAIHAEIERALADNPDVLIETGVEYNGMKAHIDCFVPGTGDVMTGRQARCVTFLTSHQHSNVGRCNCMATS